MRNEVRCSPSHYVPFPEARILISEYYRKYICITKVLTKVLFLSYYLVKTYKN